MYLIQLLARISISTEKEVFITSFSVTSFSVFL